MKLRMTSRQKHTPADVPVTATNSQKRIMTVLKQLKREISAQDLYVKLRHQHQNLGLATIYRALKALTLRGLVQTRISANGEFLYNLVEDHQHYLTCLQCGKSISVEDCPVCQLEATLRQSQPFTIYYHTLEFFGLCSPCQLQLNAGS